MKKMFVVAALAGVILSGNVLAHGAKPRHGGIVQTAGAAGALTVLKGRQKTELRLASGGNNTLVVKGLANLGKGSKAVASVSFADKKTVSVRFSLR